MKLSQAKEYLPLIQAAAEGKTIQCFSPTLGGVWKDIDPYFSSPDFDKPPQQYRIKPGPKLRAWLAEEVPVGALIRHNNSPACCATIILSRGTGGITGSFSSGFSSRSFNELLEDYKCSTDGGRTWKPCGVETAGE